MKIKEFMKQYYLHDSILEEITYDENSKILIFNITLCNWAQENYENGSPENININLIFNNIYNFNIDNSKFVLNRDSILDFEILSNNKIQLTLYNHFSDYKVTQLEFISDNVDVVVV